MSNSSVSAVQRSVTRLTIDVGSTAPDFRLRYEDAVPPIPMDQVRELVVRQAPWQEMLDLVDAVDLAREGREGLGEALLLVQTGDLDHQLHGRRLRP